MIVFINNIAGQLRIKSPTEIDNGPDFPQSGKPETKKADETSRPDILEFLIVLFRIFRESHYIDVLKRYLRVPGTPIQPLIHSATITSSESTGKTMWYRVMTINHMDSGLFGVCSRPTATNCCSLPTNKPYYWNESINSAFSINPCSRNVIPVFQDNQVIQHLDIQQMPPFGKNSRDLFVGFVSAKSSSRVIVYKLSATHDHNQIREAYNTWKQQRKEFLPPRREGNE
uniref:Uncharacterized protein n=1 Tax=Candidatus Kentrum sp. MB TaxID=2138164 RepID=A0A451BCR2_9GAMM|nr:MAG: hypothetical protein BECKMB1821G_GA0114241_10413 [Candidatus Kentron sp. MB]VFK33276.1 MAG: hypothetical protein BECKMB1821I_GA0114274_10435 [Candidatus Kentron sp. MB]VFK76077.1 MAG: hypothetical protein BECKMB1821H_GA0114242_10415 [Candidatus Kentron sp. MB]